MRVITLAPAVAALLSLPALAATQPRAALPPELPTKWEAPPGDALEHAVAGFAKVLCAAVFITGRDLATAADEDGYFVTTAEERRQVRDTVIDRARRAVHVTRLTASNAPRDSSVIRVHRAATRRGFCLLQADQLTSALPDPSTVPWPMGDVTDNAPLPQRLTVPARAGLAAAFDPAGRPRHSS